MFRGREQSRPRLASVSCRSSGPGRRAGCRRVGFLKQDGRNMIMVLAPTKEEVRGSCRWRRCRDDAPADSRESTPAPAVDEDRCAGLIRHHRHHQHTHASERADAEEQDPQWRQEALPGDGTGKGHARAGWPVHKFHEKTRRRRAPGPRTSRSQGRRPKIKKMLGL